MHKLKELWNFHHIEYSMWFKFHRNDARKNVCFDSIHLTWADLLGGIQYGLFTCHINPYPAKLFI